jgi:hypothetical protein
MRTHRPSAITDQELVDAEHGNVSDRAVLWTVVFQSTSNGEGTLTPVHLYVEPHHSARRLAIEYGFRILGGFRIVSLERCE